MEQLQLICWAVSLNLTCVDVLRSMSMRAGIWILNDVVVTCPMFVKIYYLFVFLQRLLLRWRWEVVKKNKIRSRLLTTITFYTTKSNCIVVNILETRSNSSADTFDNFIDDYFFRRVFKSAFAMSGMLFLPVPPGYKIVWPFTFAHVCSDDRSVLVLG
jgi:hypothetical protein